MRDFIITSLQSWDIKIGSTIKNTALEISKQHRVLYINTPPTYMDWVRYPFARRKKGIVQINENMWVAYLSSPIYPLNRIPWKWLFDKVNYANNKKIAREITDIARKLEFKDYIHLIDTDIYRSQYLKELLCPSLSVYYCRDYVIGEKYWRKNGTRLEPLIATKADMVLANSSLFADRFRQYNPCTFVVNTGVDLSLYDAGKSHQPPTDILPIPRPIIGYMGTLNSMRLDTEMLFGIACRMPQASFVFVGPWDAVFEKHPLRRLPNVHFLGKKAVSQLPAYIQAFDVCINPQTVNDMTYGNYPLKIDEYLAMGKPVVATSTHTMQDVFRNHVFLPESPEEYMDALQQALLKAGDKAKAQERIAFAHTHSWENSVKTIYESIELTLKGKI
ncbi:MAG: glycosyltransferase [Bacteroides sp.]|nr:glycosyltransferase [Bacteroides sp.]